MNTLREAAQQALGFVTSEAWGMTPYMDVRVYEDAARLRDVLQAALRAALAQQADLSRCPQCNGPADNGFDRSIPPSPYLCTKCMAEPVEPVAWRDEVHRLHAENASLAAALASSCDEQRHELWESGGIAGCERARVAERQRDALLEALRALLSYANVLEMRLLDADGEHRAMQKARAAIALVEGRVKAVEENT